jgi:hypothetical protein
MEKHPKSTASDVLFSPPGKLLFVPHVNDVELANEGTTRRRDEAQPGAEFERVWILGIVVI